MKKIILLLVLSLNFACKKQNQNTDKTSLKTENQLTTFGYLDGADGCSCYFARSQKEYDGQKFIYGDNYYGGDAYIAVNGEEIKINLEDQKKSTHQVEIKFTSKEQIGPETWKQTGELRVTLANGKVLKDNIVGVCGC